MGEPTVYTLLNEINTLKEELFALRSYVMRINSTDQSGGLVLTPYTQFNDGGGGVGTLGSLVISSNWKADLESEGGVITDPYGNKLCLLAVEGKVMDQAGQVGDLWQFVVETSTDRKIAVSGWAW